MFGTSGFVHVKKDKLEAWTERQIFIGYKKVVKVYILWRLG